MNGQRNDQYRSINVFIQERKGAFKYDIFTVPHALHPDTNSPCWRGGRGGNLAALWGKGAHRGPDSRWKGVQIQGPIPLQLSQRSTAGRSTSVSNKAVQPALLLCLFSGPVSNSPLRLECQLGTLTGNVNGKGFPIKLHPMLPSLRIEGLDPLSGFCCCLCSMWPLLWAETTVSEPEYPNILSANPPTPLQSTQFFAPPLPKDTISHKE